MDAQVGQSPGALRKDEGLGALTRYLCWERDSLKSHKAHWKDLGFEDLGLRKGTRNLGRLHISYSPDPSRSPGRRAVAGMRRAWDLDVV